MILPVWKQESKLTLSRGASKSVHNQQFVTKLGNTAGRECRSRKHKFKHVRPSESN